MSHYGKIHEKHLRPLARLLEHRGVEAAEIRAVINTEILRLDRVKEKRAPGKKAQREKKQARHAKTRSVRDEVFTRARLPGTFISRCEMVDCESEATELHHAFGRPSRGNPETPETCLALCHDCHHALTENIPTAEDCWNWVAETFRALGFQACAVVAENRAGAHRTKSELAALDAMRKAGTP